MKKLLFAIIVLGVLVIPAEARRRWVPKVASSGPQISDNFNRADSGTLGANWTLPADAVGIVSNQASITGTSGDPFGLAKWVGTNPLTANQYAQIVFKATSGTFSNSQIWIYLRWSAGDDFYYVFLASDGAWGVGKFISGVDTLINNGTTTALTANDVIYGSVVGTTITLKVNGATIGTGTASDISAANTVGFSFNLFSVSGSATMSADDFEASSL